MRCPQSDTDKKKEHLIVSKGEVGKRKHRGLPEGADAGTGSRKMWESCQVDQIGNGDVTRQKKEHE